MSKVTKSLIIMLAPLIVTIIHSLLLFPNHIVRTPEQIVQTIIESQAGLPKIMTDEHQIANSDVPIYAVTDWHIGSVDVRLNTIQPLDFEVKHVWEFVTEVSYEDGDTRTLKWSGSRTGIAFGPFIFLGSGNMLSPINVVPLNSVALEQ